MTTIVRIQHPVQAPQIGTLAEYNSSTPGTSEIVLSDSAKDHIRHKFNPSGLSEVNDLKALSGAFITYVEQLQKSHPHAARELAVAITNMQTASMWAVLGATKGK